MDNIPQNNNKGNLINKSNRLTMKVPFFQVPNSIFDEKHELITRDIAVYCYLARCSNQGSVAFPSLPTIGRKCKMSRSSAAEAVKSLIKHGFLSKKTIPGVGCEYEVLYNYEPVQNLDGTHPTAGRVTSPESGCKEEPSFNKNHESAHPQNSSSNGVVKKAIAKWKDLFKQQQGYNPTLTTKDVKALERIINEQGFETTEILLTEYINHANEKEAKVAGYALSWLPGAANRLLADRAERQRVEEFRRQKKLRTLITGIIYRGYDKLQHEFNELSDEDKSYVINTVEYNATLPEFKDAVAAWRDQGDGAVD